MKWIIEKLEMEMRCLEHCLDDKDWANTGCEEHKNVRRRYEIERLDLKRAISILKKDKRYL